MKPLVWLFIMPLLLCFTAKTMAANGYSIANPARLPGVNYSIAMSINDIGQIAGYAYNSINESHACLWENGTIIDLGSLPGDFNSAAFDINNTGQIVGFSGATIDTGRACLWQNGMIINLGILPGGDYSEASGINDLGQKVGSASLANHEIHACLWQNGTITDLGTLAGSEISYAWGINDIGQIAGISDAARYSYTYHACLWQNGTITDLGMLPNGVESYAWAINNAGQIVGTTLMASGNWHACLWHNGVITDLGTLPGGTSSEALGINNIGQIVGYSSTTDGDRHACLWQNGIITDLGTLPEDYNSYALDINNNGQIVGWSYLYYEEGHACIWQPDSSGFTDVLAGNWAFDPIRACVDAGIVSGYPDGTYQPGWPVTRDQMAVFISRAMTGGDANVPDGPATPTFSDVPNTGYGPDGTQPYWAYKYIEYAAANDVVRGYPEGDYKPTIALDRGQMAVFIARAIVTPTGEAGMANYIPPTNPTFPDVTSSNDWAWAYKYVEYIAAADITQGYPDRLYHPEFGCTRDQMAVYIARAFDLLSYDFTDYIPLNQGDTWTYTTKDGPEIVTVTGTMTLGGQEYISSIHTGHTNYTEYHRNTAEGCYWAGVNEEGAGLHTFDPPMLFPNGITIGQQVSQVCSVYRDGVFQGIGSLYLNFIIDLFINNGTFRVSA